MKSPGKLKSTGATRGTKRTGGTNKKGSGTATRTKANRAAGRMAAPGARLGMTPAEVRECSGQPECILFGTDDHVEWQFGLKGVDVTGSPTLFVTTLSFAAGKVVRITEKMADVMI